MRVVRCRCGWRNRAVRVLGVLRVLHNSRLNHTLHGNTPAVRLAWPTSRESHETRNDLHELAACSARQRGRQTADHTWYHLQGIEVRATRCRCTTPAKMEPIDSQHIGCRPLRLCALCRRWRAAPGTRSHTPGGCFDPPVTLHSNRSSCGWWLATGQAAGSCGEVVAGFHKWGHRGLHNLRFGKIGRFYRSFWTTVATP